MRIGFDAKRLFFNDTGLGVYSRMLVTQLHTAFPEHSYMLFTSKLEGSKYLDQFRSLPIICGKKPFFRTLGMAKAVHEASCDLFHGLSHELPIGIEKKGIKTVVTIHDLIFERYPRLYPYIDRTIYRWKWKHSCRIADAIIAVSEQTKKDLLHFYSVDPKKITIIPPMVSDRFYQGTDSLQIKQAKDKYALPERFFLFVGTISRRKNLQLIIKAMSLMSPQVRLPLFVIGDRGDAYQDAVNETSNLGLTNEVHFLPAVTNDHLLVFYQLASATIYPSLFEGFGIPIIESLQSGTPVITSDISSMPEAAGPGALYVNPQDADELAEKMEKIQDRRLSETLVKSGQEFIKRFRPQSVGRKIIELYGQILE